MPSSLKKLQKNSEDQESESASIELYLITIWFYNSST